MADKVAELEERLNRLEEKLRLTFTEVEKRLAPQPQEYTFEERIQELEDLILLLQLENTKLKEKVGEGLEFGLAPSTPDISGRLATIESELATRAAAPSDIEAKIATLEERINALSGIAPPKPGPKLEKRVKTLEALLEKHGREELEKEDVGLLADVQKILKGA